MCVCVCVCVFLCRTVFLLQALAALEVEVKAHEYLFPGTKWEASVESPIDTTDVRQHIEWAEISKIEWLLVRVLRKKHSSKTAEYVGQFTADIANICKRKWDQCLNAEIAKLCQSVLKGTAAADNKKRDASDLADDADAEEKKKKQKKDKKEKGEGDGKTGKEEKHKKDKKDKAAAKEDGKKAKKDKAKKNQ